MPIGTMMSKHLYPLLFGFMVYLVLGVVVGGEFHA